MSTQPTCLPLCGMPACLRAAAAAQFVKVELDRQQQAMGSGRAADGVFHCVVGKSFASEHKAWLRLSTV
jgi:hypothetical protein